MHSVFSRFLGVKLDVAKTKRVSEQDLYLPFRLARHLVVEDRDSIDLTTLLELLLDLLLVSGVVHILHEDTAFVTIFFWICWHLAISRFLLLLL